MLSHNPFHRHVKREIVQKIPKLTILPDLRKSLENQIFWAEDRQIGQILARFARETGHQGIS